MLATDCWPCNHWKYKKKVQKIQSPNTKKNNHAAGEIANKMEIQHTLVLVNSRFCSLTACLKNEKCNRTKCNLWRNGEVQAKTKIQSTFLEVMEKYQKNTKVQSNYKKDKRNMHMQLLKNTKCKRKNRTNNSKIHNRKKIQTQNLEHTKYKQNTNSKMSQGANPMFILKSKNQLAKINAKTTCCIF